jgi:hypothetical protein
MSGAMREFQSSFAAAILEGTSPLATGRQPGFGVHRNTVLRSAIDALAANVPSLHRLLGAEMFDAVAAAFVRAAPPRDGRMVRYGSGLPSFLSSYPPLVEHDHLLGVAELDLAWIESHLAGDAPVLAAEHVSALTAEQLLRRRLVPHPAARWLSFTTPAFTIWRQQREDQRVDDPPPWRAESALLTRPRSAVEALAIDSAEAEFLTICALGRSCEDALESVLAAASGFDIAVTLPRLLRAGAFTRIDRDRS